ncbi:MAG: glycine cleavage system protein R, partial [Planctomycetota bacterium]
LPTSSTRPLVHLDLVGQDRPGIIREISRVLAAQGVNVEELVTKRGSAANTGQPVFRATAQLRLATEGSEDALRRALEGVAADLIVDIVLS